MSRLCEKRHRRNLSSPDGSDRVWFYAHIPRNHHRLNRHNDRSTQAPARCLTKSIVRTRGRRCVCDMRRRAEQTAASRRCCRNSAKRDLSQRGHFIRAHLVQHLAGLCVLLRTVCFGLGSCQVRQNATRDRRIKPQTLERRNDSVSSEYRAKPRNTGVWIGRKAFPFASCGGKRANGSANR